MGTGAPYTKEHIEWLRENSPQMTRNDLAAGFNAKFQQSRTSDAIKSTLGREGIRSGRTGRFESGMTSWNKGKTGYMGANATSFKKGHRPHNHQPLYTERICTKDGYIYISVPERNPHTGAPTRYKQKHVWVWEQAHGPTPKGHCIIFLDGNKLNCEPANLTLVTRSELLALNLHKYAEAPPELKPSILALAKLEANAGIRTYTGQGRSREKRGGHGR